MKKYSNFIGIDVSKNTLDIIGIDQEFGVTLKHKTIENTKQSIKKWCDSIPPNAIIAFEDTGIYGYLLIDSFTKLNIDYIKVNSLDVNLSKGISRGKSDKKDALMIAKYLVSNVYQLEKSNRTENEIIKLRVLYTQREKIVNAIKCFNNNLEYEDFLPKNVIKELNKTHDSIIKNLKKNLTKIELQIQLTINAHQKIKTNFDLITSIPGVGKQTATYTLIVTQNFTKFENARKLACYAGVVPFPFQSGTSIKGRNKVSNLADKKLKSLLNMSALSAKKHDTQIKLYFDKKVKEGKNKMLILNNIRNKILHRMFAVVKRQQPYVNTHNFAA